ncbi:hypothetical protein BT93_L0471 [Corymbia citriodora subsp. variegata]|uniref:Uncharacterized protein n=1 Tax=Corymbia citriodora subsp. variegata TaxID=360336 RepID=A0A8T0CTI7_CORYI|nr:hypothetical protein BT93_L0471 [Corymbia citriodora subsp. variegata]
MGRKTQICNDGVVPIILIPYEARDNNPKEGSLYKQDELAKYIPAGGSIDVDGSRYDLSRRGDPISQVYIVFRAVNAGDEKNINRFLQKNYPGSHIKLAADEIPYMHFHLPDKGKLHLCKQLVIALDNNAAQTSKINKPTAAGTPTKADVAHLKATAQNLKKLASDLLEEVEALESRLP